MVPTSMALTDPPSQRRVVPLDENLQGGYSRTYRALSYTFCVTSNVPEVCRLVPTLLEDLDDTPSQVVHSYRLVAEPALRPYAAYVDGRLVRRVGSPLGLIDELLWHVNREALLGPDPRIAIHASSVVFKGRVFVFPAPGGFGKTTLVAGLLNCGGDYLTDEAALFDPNTAELYPYPKPMWMSPRSVRAVDGLRERLLPEYRALSRLRIYARPRDIGGAGTVNGPVHVDFVVAPTYRQGWSTVLQPVSRAAGLITLASNAFHLTRFGRGGVLTLARVVRGAQCYRLDFGDLVQAQDALESLVVGAEPTGV
jgi:hypothetical protein